MSIIVNGTTLKKLVYKGTNITKVVVNGVTVATKVCPTCNGSGKIYTYKTCGGTFFLFESTGQYSCAKCGKLYGISPRRCTAVITTNRTCTNCGGDGALDEFV